MKLENLSLEEKLELAINTTEQFVLEMLLLSPNMLIRRALLRNRNITSDMVNILAYDSVENVSYRAVQHNKCTEKREFHPSVSKCVQCSVDERKISCESCPY